jgi:hypothetical protein
MSKFFFGFLLSLLIFADPVSAVEQAGIEIHGFISQGFLWSDRNNYLSAKTEDGSFEFNEIGINFIKELNDRLRVGTQFFSRDLGRAGNNEIIVDWAYGDYRWKDWLGIRVGLMKMPYGLYNENRDQDMLRTSVFLPQSVYPEIDRDYYTRMWGIGIYGSVFLNRFGTLSYRGQIGTYNPNSDNSGLGIILEQYGKLKQIETGVQYNGSLQWDTPVKGLRLGVTGFMGNDLTLEATTNAGTDISMDGKVWATVYSSEYIWEKLTVAAAYRLQHNRMAYILNPDFYTEGYYLSASYRFTDWLEVGSCYSVLYPDRNDKKGNSYEKIGGKDFQAWQKDFAVSTRFDINEYWLLKLEAHAVDGAAGLPISDNSDGFDRRSFLFAAKLTFSF